MTAGISGKLGDDMKIAGLRTRLIRNHVPSNAYSLIGGLPNEAYCIVQEADGRWSTYYSERGLRTSLKTFETEDEACDHFYAIVSREVMGQ